jgi:hypothetical protein
MVKLKKIGGLWFLRAGRLQVSFCITKPQAKPARERGYVRKIEIKPGQFVYAYTPEQAQAYWRQADRNGMKLPGTESGPFTPAQVAAHRAWLDAMSQGN